MTRHHTNNILLARNLSFDSDVRQWNHPLMIPLCCLWTKSNNRMQVNLNMTWLFCFCFCLIRSFTCTMRLLYHSLHFQVKKIKQVDCKIRTKRTFLKKHFVISLENCTHRNVKPRKSRYWSFSSFLTPAHLYAIKGRRKRGF